MGDEMQFNSYSEKIKEYLYFADKIIKDFFEALSPIYRQDFNDNMQDVTVPLFTMLHSTSESIFQLLLNESALFDADILLRTIMEGTIKYCYLFDGDDDQRKEKYQEYKICLAEINDITDHYKAKNSMAILKKFSSNSTKTLEIQLLSRNCLNDLEKKYPKRIRSELRKKWSYQNLLKELAKKNKMFESQLATLSAYSFSSHFIHYDWNGLSIRQEQIINCDSPDNLKMIFAHAIRIISNVLSFYTFRVNSYCGCYDIYSEELRELAIAAYHYVLELDEVGKEIIDDVT